jgi:putative membrane protein
MNPAMILVWLTGLTLAFLGKFFEAGWLDVKFLLVLLLSGVHGYLAKTTKEFAADRNQRSAVFYRQINEIPTILMIAIVVLVIVKPF